MGVVEFLKDKGLQDDDINYAYVKAQVTSKEKEIKEMKTFTRHLSDQSQEKNTRILKLQKLLEKASLHMLSLKDPLAENNKEAPKEAMTELKDYISKKRAELKRLPQSQAAVFEADLKKLDHAHTCLEKKRALLAYLFLQSTEAIDSTSLITTNAYLEEFA